jgi:hypothetical protein
MASTLLSSEELARLDRIDRLHMQCDRIQAEFTCETRIRGRIGKQLIYTNQEEAANKCIQAFQAGAVWVTLVAQPGTGKTGTALSVMRQLAQHPDPDMCVSVDDIVLCTGMSDIDWEIQFSQSVLPSFRENIYHRGKLAKQAVRLAGIKTGLIITDECHVACGTDMVVHKTLDAAGLLDILELERRNMRMLEISATPEAVLYDLKKWDNKAAMVIIEPSSLYKGFGTMLAENRIHDTPSFETYDQLLDFLRSMDNRFRTTTKKYFIMRVLNTTTRDTDFRLWIERASDALGWNRPWNHDSTDRTDDIDTKMKTAPLKHTIIIVKGFWRASKRLERTHVGMTYETKPKKRDTTTTAQALGARLCDNYEYSGDQEHRDLRPLVFCDKGAIEQYIKWFENGCDYSLSLYEAPRIKSKDGHVTARASKVHHSNVKGLEDVEEDDVSVVDYDVSQIFDDVPTAKEWVGSNLTCPCAEMKLHYENCQEPNTVRCCIDPIGQRTFIRYRGANKAIVTYEQLRGAPNIGLEGNSKARIQPVVMDIGQGVNTSARVWPVTESSAIKYAVVYKKSFRKPVAAGGAGRA